MVAPPMVALSFGACPEAACSDPESPTHEAAQSTSSVQAMRLEIFMQETLVLLFWEPAAGGQKCPQRSSGNAGERARKSDEGGDYSV